MSINSQRHSLQVRARCQAPGVRSLPSPTQRESPPRPAKRRPSVVPMVMGAPNHAPGVPVMGAPRSGLHLDVMGGPDTGSRLDPMGGPDAGPRVQVMGESHLAFVDSLFSPRSGLH
jgi:hypothetical protein